MAIRTTSEETPSNFEVTSQRNCSEKPEDKIPGRKRRRQQDATAGGYSAIREPVRFHLLQHVFRDREVRRGRDHGVYAALGAQRRGLSVGPLLDLAGREHCQAVEASGGRGRFHHIAVLGATLVSGFLVELTHVVFPRSFHQPDARRPDEELVFYKSRGPHRVAPGVLCANASNRPWWQP
ncbi:MAG: hypothetical protein SGJ27_24700 [Candidatus Melainabacteria bacterium]|nr:hypothetical protein [Candidatus Melainabacteria bacterium]